MNAGSFALLLTGPPGGGKSEVLTCVHDALATMDIFSVAIDEDELARSFPAIPLVRRQGNLRQLCESFITDGQRLFLVAVTVESDDEVRSWLRTIGAARAYVVALTASSDALEARLRRREPSGWSGLPRLLQTARKLASIRLRSADMEIRTDQRSVAEVAGAIEAELRMRLQG